MKKALFVLMCVFTLAFGLYAQDAPVTTSATATAAVGHYDPLTDSIHYNDIVTINAYHCQKYMVNGALDQVGQKACIEDAANVYATRKVHNLVTNAGFDQISSAVSNTSTQAAACNYIAVTNTAITPGAGDTTLSGEIATNGLTRAQATYAHTGGTQTYTLTKVFNATGTQASQATGVFNASSVGTMCFEATYSSVTVNNGDTLTVTWTVTLS